MDEAFLLACVIPCPRSRQGDAHAARRATTATTIRPLPAVCVSGGDPRLIGVVLDEVRR